MAVRNPFSGSAVFEKAVTAILRPLVRALIAQGVTAPALYRIVKQTYVDIAADTLGPEVTDSKVSVMTGVHRRDVRTFRSDVSPQGADVSRKASILATVLGRWLADPAYLDADGGPKSIPRTAADGVSFEALVQGISRDIRPRTVLDELMRQDLIVADDQQVTIRASALSGSGDLDQKLHFFARNVGDHMSASVENLLSDPSPFMERAVFYNHLSETSAKTIETAARKAAETALLDINAQSRQLQAQDAEAGGSSHRVRFGVFFYSEDEARQNPPQPKDKDTQ